jgi:hypothetical protein
MRKPMSEPIAFDIYDRLEMNKNGDGGSVWNDLYGDRDDLPTLSELEDYFGDLDPFEFL